MKNNELIDWVVTRVQEKLHDPHKIGYAFSTTLGISTSNAYKRIRGASRLSAEELVLLLAEYDIDIQEFEGLSQRQSQLSAIRPTYIKDIQSLTTYLEETRAMLTTMVNLDHSLYYAARDLPLFHYFFSSNLARFKHLIWLRSTNYSENKKLRMEDITLGVLWESRELFDLYRDMHTEELWTERTLSNQLFQLNSLVESYILRESDALLILDDLEALLHQIKDDCKENSRHKLYLLPYLNMANNALLKTKAQKTTFLSFAGINYIRSSNASLCSDMSNWFEEQILLGEELNASPDKTERLFGIFNNQIKEYRELWSGSYSSAEVSSVSS